MENIEVLFVDDEEGVMDQAKLFLERECERIKVTAISSAKEGLKLLEEKQFDAVVSDYLMPEIHGIEFLKKIKKEKRLDIPFILFTGKGREEIAMEALNMGADRYIKKSADPKSQYGVLADAIHQEVTHYRTEKSLERKNKLLTQIFERAEEGFYIKDLSNTITFVNKSFADMHGYSQEELIGMNSRNLLTKESRKFVEDLDHQKLQDRWYEVEIITKDGKKKTFRNAVFPLKSKDGEIKERFGITVDISEKKEAEKNVEEMESLRKAIKNVNQIIAQESDLKPLLQKTCEELLKTRHYLDVKIAIRNKNDVLKPIAHCGEHSKKEWESHPSKQIDLPPCIRRVIDKKEFHTIKSVEESCYDCDYLEYDEDHSSIFIPFIDDKKVMSILSVCLPPKKEVSKKEIDLLEDISDNLNFAREKILAEKKLKQSEKRYRNLFEKANYAILIFKDFKVTDFNKEALEMFDCDEKTILGKTVHELSPKVQPNGKESKAKAREFFEIVEDRKVFEWRHKTTEGELFDAEVNLNRLIIDDQKFYQAILKDITEEKKIKEELKRKQNRFETLFEDNPEATVEIDENFQIVDINTRFESLFKYKKEEILGKNINELIVPKEKLQEARKLDEKSKEEGYFDHETVRLTKEGERVYVSITAKSIDYLDHTHHLAVYKDISKRKKTASELQRKEQQLKQLHNVALELVGVVSEEEICQITAKTAEKIMDFSKCTIDLLDEEGKLTPKAISSEMDEDGVESWKPEEGGLAGKTFLEKKSFILDDVQADPDAKPVKDEYISIISVPIGDYGVFQAISKEKGKFDKTDLELTEILMSHVAEILNRIEAKKQEDFLHSLLRHDLKNKVKLINGYLQLMKDVELKDEVEELVEKAKNVVDEEKNIINKVETMRELKEQETYEINLEQVVYDVIDEIKDVADDFEFEVETISDPTDTVISGGPVIRELFTNLIGNSVAHSEGCKVKIEIEQEEDIVRCTVEDNGKGIPEEMKTKIFKKGFKSGKHAGSGLGLYLVKEIINRYRGDIEVSDSKMGGAKFELEFKKA